MVKQYTLSKSSLFSKTLDERVEMYNAVMKSRKDILMFLDTFDAELAMYDEYKKETKVRLNEMANQLLDTLFSISCWAHHSILKGRKKDMIENMKLVSSRTRTNILENEEFLKECKEKLDKDLAEKEKLTNGRLLWKRVCNDPNFEEFKEDRTQREWDCLVDLIESGYITEKDLPDYGVFLEESKD